MHNHNNMQMNMYMMNGMDMMCRMLMYKNLSYNHVYG